MWIQSKLTPPNHHLHTINRDKINQRLEYSAQASLVLFRSPAGYGKTTMAAQWLKQREFSWVNLDEMDNDLHSFGLYLVQAMHQVCDLSCPHTLELAQKGQFNSLTSLLTQAFQELTPPNDQRFVVLDDYHVITNPQIHEGIRFLIKHLIPTLTLVVTSRTLPTIATASLRIKGQLIEITHDDLAFDHEETRQFLQQQRQNALSDEEIEQIFQLTEGWPCVLQLIALNRQSPQALFNRAQQNQLEQLPSQTKHQVTDFNKSYLWDYLTEEVFDELDEATQAFLLHCSVLDLFNAQLVADLTHRHDALAVLEQLNKFGLFLSPIGYQDNWYRFHHLFTEFLRHQCESRHPEQIHQWHQDAARAWLKQGDRVQALRHALKTCEQTCDSEQPFLVEFLTQNGWKLFNQGQLHLVSLALNKLSPEWIYQSPSLCLLGAWLAQSQFNYQAVESMLSRAEQEFHARGIPLSSNQSGAFNALRAQAAINLGYPEQAHELAKLAFEQLDETQYQSKIVATSIIGEVQHCRGQLNSALSMMQQTEKMARQHHEYHQALWSIIQQGEILLAQGYIQASYDIIQHGFDLVQAQHLQHIPLHEFLLRLNAQILWCWSRFDEAQANIEQGCQLLDAFDDTKKLHAFGWMAKIALSKGELDKAGRYLDLCQQMIGSTHYHPDWMANIESNQLLYWHLKQESQPIEQWLTTVTLPEQLNNHFEQLQARNRVCAKISLGQYQSALADLSLMQAPCRQLELTTDYSRNLILEAVCFHELQLPQDAQQALIEALEISLQSGMITPFLSYTQGLQPIFEAILTSDATHELIKHKAKHIYGLLTKKERRPKVHFDENFVDLLLNSPQVPEVIKLSPLTMREWQVLGLIYTGYSNEQIANELNVAATTIKTHIRNLYQKFNIANRHQAIEVAGDIIAKVQPNTLSC
ncbi:MAG: HTH-type transcriptional regulator MalT [Vibrio sp.]